MVDDKDIDTVLGMLPDNATYFFTQADSHRAIPVETLKAKAEEKGLRGFAVENVGKAYAMAKVKAKDNDFIFVGGSSYVVADFLSGNPQGK